MIPASMRKSLERTVGVRRSQFDRSAIKNYCRNVCGVERNVLGLIYPRSVRQIQDVVRTARRHQIPLYPVSTGKNWGLGARLPAKHGQLIVDLGQMNRILSFDSKAGVIVVEPGVTQIQISEFLRKVKAKFVLNVTGSSKDSSVVGNALERGVAHYGCRVNEVIALQVVLGTGEVLETGGFSTPGARSSKLYPFGLGPDLRGLFFQSGYGIVTSVALRLRPKREHVGVISLKPVDGIPLPRFVDALNDARTDGLLPSNVHISNRARRLSVMTPLHAQKSGIPFETAEKEVRQLVTDEWVATASHAAPIGEIQRTVRSLRTRLKGIACVDTIRGTQLYSSGIPSDDAVLSLGFSQKRVIQPNPVESDDVGTLFIVPLLPFRGQDVRNVLRIVRSQFKDFCFEPYITLNLLEGLNLEAVINLTFDRRDSKQTGQAHKCILRTFDKLLNAGYPPQRMSIFQMPRAFRSTRVARSHVNAIQALKRLFDPQNIISPGRYDPHSR